MAAQLEALLRQQLDGGGLRGRAPRQSQSPLQPLQEDILRVIEVTQCDRQSAIDALQRNGGDADAAVNELLQ
jgi:NACalpha-BTF3-like transcription factor